MLIWSALCEVVFFLMSGRPPRSTRTDTLFPYTTLFRSPKLRMASAPSVADFENLNAPRPKGPQRHRSTRHAGEQDHANRQGLEKGEHESKAASGSELREVGIDDEDRKSVV